MDAQPMFPADVPDAVCACSRPFLQGHASAAEPVFPVDRDLEHLYVQAAHRARLLGQAQFEAIARHAHPDPLRSHRHAD